MTKQISLFRENVDLIEIDDKKIYLVGTAHISQASADLAEAIIKEVNPDAVAVELCASRFESLRDPNRWKKMDLIKVLREGKAYVLLTQLCLASFQKKMGEHLKVKPGQEMIAAVNTAEAQNATIILADREIKTTLRRAWAAISYWSLCKLFFSSLFASFSSDKMEKDDIENLKSNDALEGLLKEFSEELPDVKVPLIDERDLYLAAKIREGNYKTVVAIVGAGHTPGIKAHIDQPIDSTILDSIPPATTISKAVGWILPTIILCFFVYGFFTSGVTTSWEMIKTWVIYTSVAAGIGAIICLAHPLTIIVTIVMAPIAAIHVFLPIGWCAALAEAMLRKPTVADLETVLDDITTVKGIWSNRVARIFLIMIITSLTMIVGMLWAAKLIAGIVV